MKTKLRKLTSIFLSIAILIGIMPFSVLATDTQYQNSNTITALSLPLEVNPKQEIALESNIAPTFPDNLDATITSILWEEVLVQENENESLSPNGDDKTLQKELKQTITTQNLSLAVEWELLGDVLFSTENEASFTYIAKLTDNSYTISDEIIMPEIVVNIVNNNGSNSNSTNSSSSSSDSSSSSSSQADEDNKNSGNSNSSKAQENDKENQNSIAPNLSQRNTRATGSVIFAGQTLVPDGYYVIEGNAVTTLNASNENYDIHLSNDTQVLTLNEFSLREISLSPTLVSTYENLTISILGSVSIVSTDSSSILANNLTFIGGNLTIESQKGDGITANGDVIIKNTLTVYGDNAIKANNLYMQSGGNLSAGANTGNGYGITATQVTVPEGTAVWVSGASARDSGNGGNGINAIVNVTGGSVTAYGGNLDNAIGDSAGFAISRLILESGKVTAIGGSAEAISQKTGGNAIAYDATVNGGELKVYGGNGGLGGTAGHGIGFHLFATGGESYIKGGDLRYTDGTLGYAINDGGGEKSTIAGGNVYATGGFNFGTNGALPAYRNIPNIIVPQGKQADHSIGLSAPGTYTSNAHEFLSRYVGISYSIPGEVSFAGINLAAGSYYKFSENGSMAIGSASDYNVSFLSISGKNTLSLNGVSIYGSFAKSLITAAGDLDIVLMGNSSLTNSQTGTGIIEVAGNLNFYENGSLSVFGREFGIKSGGNTTINGGAITNTGSIEKGFEANKLILNTGTSLTIFGPLLTYDTTVINSDLHVSANAYAIVGNITIDGESSVTATGLEAFANKPVINNTLSIIAGDNAQNTFLVADQSTDYHKNKFVRITTQKSASTHIAILDKDQNSLTEYTLESDSYYKFDSINKTLIAATNTDYDILFEVKNDNSEKITLNNASLIDSYILSQGNLEIVLVGANSISNPQTNSLSYEEKNVYSSIIIANELVFSGEGSLVVDARNSSQDSMMKGILSIGNMIFTDAVEVSSFASMSGAIVCNNNLTVYSGAVLTAELFGSHGFPINSLSLPIFNTIAVQNDFLLYGGTVNALADKINPKVTQDYNGYYEYQGSGLNIAQGNLVIRGGNLKVTSAKFHFDSSPHITTAQSHNAIFFLNENSNIYIYALPANIEFIGTNNNIKPIYFNADTADVKIDSKPLQNPDIHDYNKYALIQITAKEFPDIDSMMFGDVGIYPRTVFADGVQNNSGDSFYLGQHNGTSTNWVMLKDKLMLSQYNLIEYNSLTEVEKTAVTSNSFSNLSQEQAESLVGQNSTDNLYNNATTKPTFVLNGDAILFRHTDANGDNGEAGITKDTEVGVLTKQFEVGESATGNTWNLTLYDASRDAFAAYNLEILGKEISFEYDDATVGENEYISVIIGDGLGGILYYGKVLALPSGSAVSGKVSFTLPDDLDIEKGDYLDIYAFNEQVNGEMNTDYSSKLIPVPAIAQSALNAQTITFTQDTIQKQYGDATFVNSLSGAKTNVSYQSSDTKVASVNPNTGHITIVGRGTATITATAQSGIGSDGKIYSSNQDSFTITVAKKEIIVTNEDFTATKVYDSTTSGTTATGSGHFYARGIASSDLGTVKVVPVIGDFSDEDVATQNKTATVTFTLSGDTNDNYTIATSSVIVPATITKKIVTWKQGVVEDKTFDTNTNATILTQPILDGIIVGDNISVTNGSAKFITADVQNDISVLANGYVINGTDKDNYTLPTTQPSFANADITKATFSGQSDIAISAKQAQSVSVNLTNYLTGLKNPVFEQASVVNSDSSVVTTPTYQINTTGVLAFDIKNTATLGLHKKAITLTIKSDNHQDITVYIDITVMDKDIPVLSADNLIKEYDGKAFSQADITNKTATFAGVAIAGDWSLETVPNITNADTTQSLTLKFTPKDGAKYATVTMNINSEITKKPITISVKLDKSSLEIGGTLPTPSVDYGAVITGESLVPVGVIPQFIGIPADGKTAGKYTVTWSNMQAMQLLINALATADNYDISYVDTAVFSINSTVTPPATKTHTITATARSNGSISPSGDIIVTEGSNQTFTIAPHAGYKVLNVVIDGINYGSITSYTFENVTKAHSISATFAQDTTTDTQNSDNLGEELNEDDVLDSDDNSSDSTNSENLQDIPKIDITDSGQIIITPAINSGELSSVVVSDSILSEDDYMLSANNSITLTSQFISTLSSGEHDITITYENTQYQASVIIDSGVALSASPFKEVKTENGSSIPISLILLAIVIIVSVVLFVVFKKKGKAKQ